ncbi:MAG: hypothetical protein ACI8ZW_001499, partial [Yoonia sp.]
SAIFSGTKKRQLKQPFPVFTKKPRRVNAEALGSDE